jgi:photosystem II stability/assembly factor-like uncharacterized protein
VFKVWAEMLPETSNAKNKITYFAIAISFTMIMPLPNIRISFFVLMALAVFMGSCKKENEGYAFESYNVGLDVRLNDMEINAQGDLLACGGKRDVQGYFFRSEDNGASWSVQDGGLSRSVNTIHMIDELRGWAGGGFLELWRTFDGGATWIYDWIGKDVPLDENQRPSITKFQFLSDSVFFFVGGENYSKGVVYRSMDNGRSFDFQFYHNEIRGIHMTSPEDGMVCGHGRFLSTSTGMDGWSDLEMQNDFYTGLISFNSHLIMTTSTGKILKSEDQGYSWERVLDGSNWFSWNMSFNDIYSSEQSVVAVGNDGLFAVSHDEGLSWETYELSEPVELLSVYMDESDVWCSSTNGNVIRFDLP